MLAAVGRSNAIVVYPAYYGGNAGASGCSPGGLGGQLVHTVHHIQLWGQGRRDGRVPWGLLGWQ